MSATRVEALISTVERDVARRTDDGQLAHEAVEALDVVYHALVYDAHPRGLAIWREALWEGRVTGEAREAMASMFDHLLDAVDRGETDAVNAICDCLEPLLATHA